MHPVPRPPVERLEAGRFLGDQRLLQGASKREDVTKADATGAEVVRPHRAVATSRPTPSPSSTGATAWSGSPSRRSSTAARSARGPTSTAGVELGKFITDPKNDDLAKAFVNRMWGHFLGRGFVHPVDDFGPHNPPSHPELLDKLAKEFQTSRLRRQGADPLDHDEPGLPPLERR